MDLMKIMNNQSKVLDNISKGNDKALKKFLKQSILSDIRKERKYINAKLKKAVYERYGGKCNVCKIKRGLDIHHINMKNSDNRLSNLRLLCVLHHRLIHEKKHKKVYSQEWRRKNKKK